ncbi:signal peptidase I [Streptomyces jumonjinensis]|uniref:signal peptidase I n=1 Tax=Streptomyces jumonjinensis TaxID=1945 RepID=UPI0037A7B9DA
MDTAAKHTERDHSSDPDAGDAAEGSRSVLFRGGRSREGTGTGTGTGTGPGAAPSWRRTGVLALVITTLVLLFSRFVVQPFQIPSGSMEPTLRVGDRVLVNKLAYRFDGEPRRGDLIVFDGRGSFVQGDPAGNPVGEAAREVLAALGLTEPDETDFIKRVVGVGGDRVVCCDASGRVSVNGAALDEGYLRPGDAPSEVPFDIVVPPGRLWVMGDHRSNSRDSRDLLGAPGGGMVPVEKVVGRADWIGWPLGRWTSLERADVFARVPDAPSGGHQGASGGPPGRGSPPPEPGGAHG